MRDVPRLTDPQPAVPQPLSRPLDKTTVALVTSAGISQPGQPPMDGPNIEGDYTIRLLDIDTPISELSIWHTHFDLAPRPGRHQRRLPDRRPQGARGRRHYRPRRGSSSELHGLLQQCLPRSRRSCSGSRRRGAEERSGRRIARPSLTALSPIRRIGRSRSGASRHTHGGDCDQPRTDRPGHASARPIHPARTWQESWHAWGFRSAAGDPAGGAAVARDRARAVHDRRLAARNRGCLIHLSGGP